MQDYLYAGWTLVDITNTGYKTVTPGHELERNQQRNWDTLSQVLGLRTQITFLQSPVIVESDVSLYEFGLDFKNQIHKIWTFRFATETPDVFSNQQSPTGALEIDCAGVPIIVNLTETARITVPIFCFTGSQKNIYFSRTDK